MDADCTPLGAAVDSASRLPAYKKPRPIVHRARQVTWPGVV